VPITSGVLHARLQPVATGTPDGGLAPRIAPTFAPDAAVPPDAIPSVTPLPSPAVTPLPSGTAPPAAAPPATAPPGTPAPAPAPAPAAPGSAGEPRQPGLAPPT
jgi:type IV secretion system protein VirB8